MTVPKTSKSTMKFHFLHREVLIILLLSAGFVWVRPSRLPSVFMPSHGSVADLLAFVFRPSVNMHVLQKY